MQFLYISTTALAFLYPHTFAKKCVDLTIPITISANTSVFNIDVPQTDLDAIDFIQNVTKQGQDFVEIARTGFKITSGTYSISAQFCSPDKPTASTPVLQILTHGIGFDKNYWDSPYDRSKYSYVNSAVDKYGYHTLAYDRLGVGKSSHGEPLNEIQASLEVAALAEMTRQFRTGTYPRAINSFTTVVHVGHSFGSAQTYSLVSQNPQISDGIVLTGFTMNTSFLGYFASGANFVQANKNQPLRFGKPLLAGISAVGLGLNYVNGYLTNSNVGAQQYLFFLPKYFDVGALNNGESTKQPVTPGEILTLAGIPQSNAFGGPVLAITGSGDLPYCGGDCLATGDPNLPSIMHAVGKSFPNARDNFRAYVQPNTGHSLNFHFNVTGSYDYIASFLAEKGLKPT